METPIISFVGVTDQNVISEDVSGSLMDIGGVLVRADRDQIVTQLTLDYDMKYTYAGHETASWSDTYLLKAGTYDVTYTTSSPMTYYNGKPVYWLDKAYARIDAILLEEYRVSRLGSASRAEVSRPEKQTTYSYGVYAFLVHPGKTYKFTKDGFATVSQNNIHATISYS